MALTLRLHASDNIHDTTGIVVVPKTCLEGIGERHFMMTKTMFVPELGNRETELGVRKCNSIVSYFKENVMNLIF